MMSLGRDLTRSLLTNFTWAPCYCLARTAPRTCISCLISTSLECITKYDSPKDPTMVSLEVFIIPVDDIDIITVDFNALKEKEHVNIYNDNDLEGVAAATSEDEMDEVTSRKPRR